MSACRLAAGLFFVSSLSCSLAFGSTITFEELGNISGVMPIGIIGDADFGTLGAFDTTKPDYGYLAASPTNSAYFAPRLIYEIKMANGADFDFLGASFARSYAEGDYFQLLEKGMVPLSIPAFLKTRLSYAMERQRFLIWHGLGSTRFQFPGLVSVNYAAHLGMPLWTISPIRSVIRYPSQLRFR